MGEIKLVAAMVLKDMVVLPGMIVNFDISKNKDLKNFELAMLSNSQAFVVCEREEMGETPDASKLYPIGSLVRVRQISKLPNHHMQLMIEALSRGRVLDIQNDENQNTKCHVEEIEEANNIFDFAEKEAMLRTLNELFGRYGAFYPNVSKAIVDKLNTISELGPFMDTIAANIPINTKAKQMLLEALDIRERFNMLVRIVTDEIQIADIRKEIAGKIRERVNKNQKEYVLREQLSEIRKELGDDGTDGAEFEAEVNALCASDEVKAKIMKEVRRLQSLNNVGSEAQVERGHIETLLELPWDKASEDNNDIAHARQILDEDHYGLEEVKERVLEFLAVRTLNGKGESPIICLVGPPGTGKTSIAKSVARALNKQYVRICLGGVRDEAEIRGHRKTYIGAMPGRIAGALRQTGVKNPLMLLDEIDKLSSDYHGDTSSALLEVLDSEQNSHFRDHYIEIPIDLSEVLFVATANSVQNIPRPLLDRMEVIEVTSYTSNEKFHIAKEHLIRHEFEKNGIAPSKLKINDAALKKIIESYTREAGVRDLERKISKICRKAAIEIMENKAEKVLVTTKNLSDFLGKEKYRKDVKNRKNDIGIVRGLAWTSVGGDTLQIEVNVMPGKGEIDLTGQMGDVMKESAKAGISYIRSIADEYNIPDNFFKEHDVHIHIPEGAVPKDGPSAGITMATAVLSAITKIPVDRNIAMTGEITLRGRVLPIGGLKEKSLAAKTAGINTVLVPAENEPDVNEIPNEIREGMDFVYVSDMKQVLEHALVR